MPYRFHDATMMPWFLAGLMPPVQPWGSCFTFVVWITSPLPTAVVRSKGRSCVRETVTSGRKVLHYFKAVLCLLVFVSPTNPSLGWGLENTPASLGQF